MDVLRGWEYVGRKEHVGRKDCAYAADVLVDDRRVACMEIGKRACDLRQLRICDNSVIFSDALLVHVSHISYKNHIPGSVG